MIIFNYRDTIECVPPCITIWHLFDGILNALEPIEGYIDVQEHVDDTHCGTTVVDALRSEYEFRGYWVGTVGFGVSTPFLDDLFFVLEQQDEAVYLVIGLCGVEIVQVKYFLKSDAGVDTEFVHKIGEYHGIRLNCVPRLVLGVLGGILVWILVVFFLIWALAYIHPLNRRLCVSET